MSLDDTNWQMTVLFLLAVELLSFSMKLTEVLLPGQRPVGAPLWVWQLPAFSTFRRSKPVDGTSKVWLRLAGLAVAVALAYWACWQAVQGFHLSGLALSYLAAPILWLTSECLQATGTVLMLPSGWLLPRFHHRPFAARSIADFWGNRWNHWFGDWCREVIFKRMPKHPAAALLLAFIWSGLVHEWAINVPLYFVTSSAPFGSMLLYFPLQGVGILLERRFLKRHPLAMRVFTWLVVFGPVPLVVNEGLIRALHLWP